MSILLLVVVVGAFLIAGSVRAQMRASGSPAAARMILGPALLMLGVVLFPFVLLSRLLLVVGAVVTGLAALALAMARRR